MTSLDDLDQLELRLSVHSDVDRRDAVRVIQELRTLRTRHAELEQAVQGLIASFQPFPPGDRINVSNPATIRRALDKLRALVPDTDGVNGRLTDQGGTAPVNAVWDDLRTLRAAVNAIKIGVSPDEPKTMVSTMLLDYLFALVSDAEQ